MCGMIQYINIRRGQVICAFIGGWALCPWEILARFVLKKYQWSWTNTQLCSATGFLSFMVCVKWTIYINASLLITDITVSERLLGLPWAFCRDYDHRC